MRTARKQFFWSFICAFAVYGFTSGGNFVRGKELPDGDTPAVSLDSLEDLQVRQYYDGAFVGKIDMQLQLVFAARYWNVFFVQQGHRAAMIKCKAIHSELLCNLRVGALLRIRGSTDQDSIHINAETVEVIDPNAKLTASLAENLSSNGHAPINGLTRIGGTSEEVFIGTNQSALFLRVGYIPVELELLESLRANDGLPLIRRSVTAEGALCRNFPGLDAIYLIRMMHRNQLVPEQQTDDVLDIRKDDVDYSQFNIYSGKVVFSDQRSKLVVATQDRVRIVWSRFARRVRPGEKIIVYEMKDLEKSNTDGSITSSAIITQSMSSLSAGVILSIDEIFDRNSLPERVSIRARVKQVRINDGECELGLTSNSLPLTAVIPSNSLKLNSAGYQLDDEILITGTPLLYQDESEINAQRGLALRLYASSESDLQFVAAPLRIPLSRIALAVFSVVLLLGLGAFRNRHLQKQIGLRTEKLEEVSSQFQKTFEAVREVVLVTDKDQKLSGANHQIQSFFGFTPAPQQDVLSIMRSIESQMVEPLEFRKFYLSALSEKKRPTTSLLKLHSPSRTASLFSCAIVDSNQGYSGNLWMFEDITEKLRLEGELLQAKKMELVGQMSNGMAHDFNNLLTVIRSNLTMVRIASQSQRCFSSYISSAESAISRGADLIRQLLDFSRQSQLSLETIDANQYLMKLYEFLRKAIDESVEMELRVVPSEVYINVDPSRLEHVLVNVCFNARDALPQHGGRIKLNAYVADSGPLLDALVISISDNGCGMSPEVKTKIFEPFFSTKPSGSGTGLGLAMASGIVEQFGGCIEFDSELGIGTTFRIIVPTIAPPTIDNALPIGDSQMLCETMRILVVDDEELVRDSCSAILESLGHSVVTAENGRVALEILRSDYRFDAALLDLSMPVMSGRDAFREIREILPELPIAICSAHANQATEGFYDANDDHVPVIRKPYFVNDLEAGLQQLCRRKRIVVAS